MTQTTMELSTQPRTTQRHEVYEFIRMRGHYGATDVEIQKGLNLSGDSERPRRQELEKAGRIYTDGTTRATTRGGKALVWLADVTKK